MQTPSTPSTKKVALLSLSQLHVALGSAELDRVFRSAGGVTVGVGVGADACELAILADQVLVTDGLVVKEALQCLHNTSSISARSCRV